MINFRNLSVEQVAQRWPVSDGVSKARDALSAQDLRARATADFWLDSAKWPEVLPAGLSEVLSGWQAAANGIGDRAFAVFLGGLAGCGLKDQTRTPRKAVLFATGAADAQWEMWRCDSILRAMPRTRILDGSGDRAQDLAFEYDGSPLIFTVKQTAESPEIIAPVVVDESGEVFLDISNVARLPSALVNDFVWAPSAKASLGGDLLARNSMVRQQITYGAAAVGRYPVTVEFFMTNGGNIALASYNGKRLFDDDGNWLGELNSPQGFGGSNELPIVGLSLPEVEEFVAGLPPVEGYSWRLPTSIEWEGFMRGPEGLIYPWGDTWIPGAANIREGRMTAGLEPVGLRLLDRSISGICDGAGNVEEWTLDSDADAIARGGSWYNQRQVSRCASLLERSKDYRHSKLSFRLVLARVEQ